MATTVTSRPAPKNSAFTLIELNVVILCLVLIAALIVPRLASVQRGIDAKLSLDAVQRLASRARETSMGSGQPVTMRFDSAESQFTLVTTNTDGEEQTVGTVTLYPDIVPQRFFVGDAEPSATDWNLAFYSDGTSDGGGVEVDEGGTMRSLVIGSKSGLAKWQNGAMPASETERWQAGEYERRG